MLLSESLVFERFKEILGKIAKRLNPRRILADTIGTVSKRGELPPSKGLFSMLSSLFQSYCQPTADTAKGKGFNSRPAGWASGSSIEGKST